jgi:hypothetical protein
VAEEVGPLAVFGAVDGVARRLQGRGELPRQERFVLDDQDPQREPPTRS